MSSLCRRFRSNFKHNQYPSWLPVRGFPCRGHCPATEHLCASWTSSCCLSLPLKPQHNSYLENCRNLWARYPLLHLILRNNIKWSEESHHTASGRFYTLTITTLLSLHPFENTELREPSREPHNGHSVVETGASLWKRRPGFKFTEWIHIPICTLYGELHCRSKFYRPLWNIWEIPLSGLRIKDTQYN